MTPETIADQAEALVAYLSKVPNMGASAWCDSKGFSGPDRAAILRAAIDFVAIEPAVAMERA